MVKIFIIVISASLILLGCSQNPSEEIGYGLIEKGVYSNSYFNMSIDVPEAWVVHSQAMQKEMMEKGVSLFSGNDDNLKAILKESEKQTVNMFSFFKYEQGAPVPFNPSVISVAEMVVKMPGIKRGSDYLFHVKKFLGSGQLEYRFPSEIYSKSISGVSFDVMSAEIDAISITVHQDYYAVRMQDYMLTFVLSYSSESERKELNEIISKLEFSN